MPQVKELKELGVAGSATNEQGRYGSGMAPFIKSLSCLPIFCTLATKQEPLQAGGKTVTSKRLSHLTSKNC